MLRRVWNYIWEMEWVFYLFRGFPRVDVWSEIPDEKPEKEVSNIVQLFPRKSRYQRVRVGISKRFKRIQKSTSRLSRR